MPATSTKGPPYRQRPLRLDSNRFFVEVETAVRTFPRYQKYTLGSDLRRQAMHICSLVARAAQWRAGPERARLLERLAWQVEDVKMSLRLGKELEVFAAFAQFQHLAEQAVAIGRQSGGGQGLGRQFLRSPPASEAPEREPASLCAHSALDGEGPCSRAFRALHNAPSCLGDGGCVGRKPHQVHGSPSSNFWSGSPSANKSNNAWKVNFNNGNANKNNRSSNKHVRLVRGGE